MYRYDVVNLRMGWVIKVDSDHLFCADIDTLADLFADDGDYQDFLDYWEWDEDDQIRIIPRDFRLAE